MKLGETIRKRRKELNLTQEQMAAYLGVTAPAVHKWEKGISYPDAALLPAVARLLKMDLNGLFSFEQELSPQEISTFGNNVMELIMEQGFETGYAVALEKLRQYPTCASLLYQTATLLDGAMSLFLVGEEAQEREKYTGRIEEMYRQAALLGDGQIRSCVDQMLFYKYLDREEYEKAQELVEEMPKSVPDVKQMKATLAGRRENYGEAITLMEEKLYQSLGEVQNALSALQHYFYKEKDGETARLCMEKAGVLVEQFGLWKYGKYEACYEDALYRQDREDTYFYLEQMLSSMIRPYHLGEFPLYRRMKASDFGQESGNGKGAEKKAPGKETEKKTETGRRSGPFGIMLPALLGSLRDPAGLDGKGFLAGDPKLEALIRKYEAVNGNED